MAIALPRRLPPGVEQKSCPSTTFTGGFIRLSAYPETVPKVDKQALSSHVRTRCERQLRLSIATNAERAAQGMPGEQPPRPGLQDARAEGLRWQHEKVTDLVNTFGAGAVLADANLTPTGVHYRPVELDPALTSATAAISPTAPTIYIVEPVLAIGPAFEAALGIAGHRTALGLEYAELRPDLVELSPRSGAAELEVLPSGETRPLTPSDSRLRLRVIDIKLTAEPSPGYFAEVTLYSMALAGWLTDHQRDGQFVVTASAALWPGSHDASNLSRTVQHAVATTGAPPTPDEMRSALAEDLEEVPFEVFVPEVRRFFTEHVPGVLAKVWTDTEYHVDNRCKGCPFLGAPWLDGQGNPTAQAGHCVPVAQASGHLSRVAYVSPGARTALEHAGVADVASLAGRQANDPALGGHHVLRGSRTVVRERADVLHAQRPAALAPDSGTSATMPKWADLRIHLSVDFDASSAITAAFGVQAFWLEPTAFGAPAGTQRNHRAWNAQVWMVDQRSVAAEQRELLAFLAHLESILSTAHGLNADTTYQIYIWDRLQLKHLARVIGRHLPAILADPTVRDLAWLFPSEELVPDPEAISRRSPLTVLRDVVRSMVAAPIDHYYSLLSLARQYHAASLPTQFAGFSVHPLFEDPLSDQIPSERAHEVWSRSTNPNRPWLQQIGTFEETVKTRLRAAETVRRRLEDDLRGQLRTTAPKIRSGGMQPEPGISQMSQLWLAHARINAAFEELDVAAVRAMPPHERESRFRSARLSTLLTGPARAQALAASGITRAQAGDLVYEMRPESSEVRIREGDFDVAVVPEAHPALLDQRLSRAAAGTPLTANLDYGNDPYMANVLGVKVVAIDRTNHLIVLRPDDYWPNRIGVTDPLAELQRHGVVDLTRDCILDPVHKEFFVDRLRDTLRAIRNPPLAAAASTAALRAALGDTRPRGPRRSPHVPAAELLWDPASMHATAVARDALGARQRIEAAGVTLNDSQWTAFHAALTLRLQPIWGPPGTGKSRTLRTIALGAAVEAHDHGRPLRLLIGASNYNALDNVLTGVAAELPGLLGPGADHEIARLRSTTREPNPRSTAGDVPVERNLGQAASLVLARLQRPTGITVVGATPMQLYKLLQYGTGSPMMEAFDLLLLDEASQTDVASTVLFAAAMATGAAVVPAGDTRQLPPITKAQAPLHLEALVGSFLGLLEDHYEIAPAPLEINYRSNAEIVALAHVAGYHPTLRPASPNLRLDLDPPGGGAPPAWPGSLVYNAEWESLLDPDQPVTAFVYDDQEWSSQWNGFEAQAVAALICALRPRMQADLLNEIDHTGAIMQRSRVPIGADRFWADGVGVVTPHRAQQALVISELVQAFPGVREDLIRDAVDTVERFQGQQRDVIIVSYALGDPDAIAEEDEFLMSFNRFNVAASRARAKLIVLVSQQVISHLSGEVEVLQDSRLLKQFATSFCSAQAAAQLPYRTGQGTAVMTGRRLWHP
jgi:hypothetical protein